LISGLVERSSSLVDYTIGFEVSNTRTSANGQRVQDATTRRRLHEFFRSLPGDRFPTLIAVGEHVWRDNRDERFAARCPGGARSWQTR